jgi:cobalt-zinc-cadmium resistance protein CzcA
MNISAIDVFTALEKNNSIAGGAYIEVNKVISYELKESKIALQDIENIVVKTLMDCLFM